MRRCSYQSRDGSWLVKHFNFWRLPKQKSVNFGSWIFSVFSLCMPYVEVDCRCFWNIQCWKSSPSANRFYFMVKNMSKGTTRFPALYVRLFSSAFHSTKKIISEFWNTISLSVISGWLCCGHESFFTHSKWRPCKEHSAPFNDQSIMAIIWSHFLLITIQCCQLYNKFLNKIIYTS